MQGRSMTATNTLDRHYEPTTTAPTAATIALLGRFEPF